ncbi:MFS transporter, MCP family, solute carrier family 16, member 10 [Podospora didyma]|uniref:MFS transporter, MCP family, solute carrier family 16, member 10 n=1 Tax=Podospora didyma TaxID=330526 RepID=A0AAE0K1Q8_9PEZI|nr:MFS transporter, MCP family, solute carrier family 16, member 10 [Podospora didyma]
MAAVETSANSSIDMETLAKDRAPTPPLPSAVSMPGPSVPAPPPNGGTTAWLQVVGAFLLFFSSWGLINTFGVFQEYYSETYLASFPPSSISWIGTAQGFLLINFGVLSGPLYDMGYLRGLIGTGAGLIFMGLLVAGEVREFFGIFLSLSVMVGLGAGCLFVPSVAIVSQYFTSRRPFATGIAAAGGSFGGVVFPIIFRHALDNVGYSWSCRILAFIVLAALAGPFLLMKPRVIPSQKRKLFDFAALKDSAFLLFSLSLFFTFVGLYEPFFYIPSYSKTELGVGQSLGFYMLSVLNAGSFFGRLIPNLVANYTGSMNALLSCICISGVLIFCWIPVKTLAGLIPFAILYGFFSGAVVSLPPTAMVTLSPDISKVGQRMGMSFSFAGFGLLVGNPIAGAILRGQSKYLGLQVFSGVTVMVGFVLLLGALLVHKARVN